MGPARLASLLEAMRSVALRYQLGSASLSFYRGDLDLVEGYAHELAHRMEAGPGFERVIDAASPDQANQHEAAALRIEVAALSALGIRVSLRRLWRVANWNGEAPTFQGSLNARERACARRMANLVKRRVADC